MPIKPLKTGLEAFAGGEVAPTYQLDCFDGRRA